MRNRGVEIYMLNEKEGNIINTFDLKSLINLKGLSDKNHIAALINIHEFVSDLVVGEKPNITHLLQCSFLISQQVLRGVPLRTAFNNAVLDIYCKPRSMNDFNTNDTVTTIKTKITEVLLVKNKQNTSHLDDLYNCSVTLKPGNFHKYSEIEKIKQQSAFLNVYLSGNESCRKTMFYFLIQLYSVTSVEDLSTRNLFLKQLLQKSEYLDAVVSLQEILANILPKTSYDLPQDFRWLPDTMYNNRNVSSSNKMFLAMFLSAKQMIFNEQLKATKKHKGMLLIEYMENVLAKKMEAKIEDVFVTEALNLLKAYDGFLQRIIHDDNVEIADHQIIELLSLIKWRFVLNSIMLVQIQKIKPVQLRELLVNLHIHYKWFTEFAVNKLSEVLNIQVSKDLNLVLQKIDSVVSKRFSLVRKIAECYQEQIKPPPPLINEVQLKIVPEFNGIVRKFDIYNRFNDFENVMSVIEAEEQLRFYLVNVHLELDFEFTKVPDDFLKLKQIIAEAVSKPCNKYMVHLLPIVDYFSRLIVLKIKTNFDIQGHENQLKNQVNVPCSLAGVLLRYSKKNDERLAHEILTEIHRYLMKSAACAPQQFLNFQNTVNEEDDIVLVLPQSAPVLSILVLKLLMPSNEENNVVTQFGVCDLVTNQRRTISLLLWKNMQQLSSTEYDQLANNINYVIQEFTAFLNHLAAALNVEVTQADLLERTQILINHIENTIQNTSQDKQNLILLLNLCCKEIQELQSHVEFTSKTISIANVYMLLGYLKTFLNINIPVIDPMVKITLLRKYCLEDIEDSSILKRNYELQNCVYSDSYKSLHAYTPLLDNKIERLNAENEEYQKYVSVRPKDSSYDTLTQVYFNL